MERGIKEAGPTCPSCRGCTLTKALEQEKGNHEGKSIDSPGRVCLRFPLAYCQDT